MRKTTLTDVKQARAECHSVESTYLEQHGWVHSNNHPGGLWFWARPVNTATPGMLLAATIEQALSLQEEIND